MASRIGFVVTIHGVMLAVVGAAPAFVGVDDPCPWPTPYPPPGVGWADVLNDDFESGFTGGVANQWTSWKDSGLPGTLHYIGSDRAYDGSFSQQLILPQPTQDWQEAGIYQRFYVVPGASYTVTTRIFLDFAGNDDLLGWVGLDPYGQDSGDGSGMKWSVNVATRGQWIEATKTVTAVFPVMAVGLKATRKWPWHGDGAKVYFDHVTLSGPVPTDPPPGPEDDPIDPETLIPETMGGNLLANPSFEQTYTHGVSAGWNKWWTSGSGEWKRSLRVGKVGGGKYDCQGESENVDMRPKTVLVYGGRPPTGDPNDPGPFGVYGTVTFWNTFPIMDDTIVVGRPAVDDNWATYRTNPGFYGRQLADQLKLVEQVYPRIDCWQGINEPGTDDPDWQPVIQFEKAFTERAHEIGLKTVVLNLATGNPGNIWQMIDTRYDPHCGELLAIADYLGHHVYGSPTEQFMVTNQVNHDTCSFALRPRRFKDMYDRRGWRFPPVIATEGSTWGGWVNNFSEDEVYTDLVTMGEYMTADRWWCGYTNFVVGAMCSWWFFDIVGHNINDGRSMAEAIGDWNEDHPADAMDGYHAQIFGAGEVHPKTLGELTPAGLFNGGINHQVTGLIPGEAYLLICWMKYEFRGHQPDQLAFHLGVDPTGQTSNGNAGTIDWGADQIADKAPTHEIFTHVWRTFTATGTTAGIWLRAHHPTNDPSFKVYVDLVEVKQLDDAPPGPFMEVSPAQIDVSTQGNENPPNGSFTVRNGGIDTITYDIAESCDWLSVQPDSGTSTGESDTITITYDVTGLGPGPHVCPLTVTAPEATNSPLAAPVITLTIDTVGADFDADGDVDQDDYGHFQACITGVGVSVGDPACVSADFDADDDVDETDFDSFAGCMSGAGLSPDPTCLAQ